MSATQLHKLLCLTLIFVGVTPYLRAQQDRIDAVGERFRRQVHHVPDSALLTAEEHMRMARAAGDRKRMVRSHAMLGQAWRMKGHPDRALVHFQQALSGMVALGDAQGTAMLHGNIADVHLSQGHWEPAATHARASMQGFEAIGQRIWAAASLRNLAVAYVGLGRDDSARIFLARAAPALEQAGVVDHVDHLHALREGLDAGTLEVGDPAVVHRSIQLRTKLSMARSMRQLGLYERAARTLREVLHDAAIGGFDEDRMEAHHQLALLLEERGDPQHALEQFKRYMALKDSIASQHTAVAVAELQERYEGARKDAALKEQLFVNGRQRTWLIAAASGMLILAMLAGILLHWRRRESSHLQAIAQRNSRLDAALAEKDLLLQEVHHRVKNNLQMVGSLLRMQGRSISDPLARQAVRDSQDRVRSMALIHQDLYGEGHTQGIDMGGYVERLANGLLRSHGFDDGRVSLHVDVPPLRLDVDTAVPIGLILNELIVNALKHAFPDGRAGILRVSLHRQVDGLHLEVSDDGVGLTVQAMNEEGGGGFGLGMLRTFAEKLQADHETIGEDGTTVRMRIKAYRMAG